MRCPSCASDAAEKVAKKGFVTELWRCNACHLLYGRPLEPPAFAEQFYEHEYRSGMTTSPPGSAALADMLRRRCSGSDKDLGSKIDALKVLGMQDGASAGLRSVRGIRRLAAESRGVQAEGYEIAKARAEWGPRNLEVLIHTVVTCLTGSYDAVFPNHVREHIANPATAIAALARC